MSKVLLDFHILPISDPRIISVMDNSVWAHIENKPAIIEITLPGSTKVKTHYFQKGKLNNFNSINLGISCSDCDDAEYESLEDGMYKFTIKGSPDTFYVSKYHLQTANARLQVDKLLIDLNPVFSELDEKKTSRIDFIEFCLSSAEANARAGNLSRAKTLFTKAQDKLEELASCPTCF